MSAGGKTKCSRWKKASKIALFFLTDEHQPVLHPAKHVALLSLRLLVKCLRLHFPFQLGFFPKSISLATE